MARVIDEVSNLPQLPEGLFFRVENPVAGVNYLGYNAIPDVRYDRKKLVVSIMRRIPEKVRITTTSKRRWYWPWSMKRIEHRRTTPAHEVYTSARDVPVLGLHTIAVRNAAYRALKIWERQQTINNLRGDYPPKRLED